MSIYHLESYNSLQTPGVRFDTVPDYAELLALLNLVIPSSDVLLPPVETPLTGDSPPISTPFCTSQDVFECAFQVDSSRYLSEPVSSVTPNLPSSEQISDWIEPMPYRCLDPAFSSDTPLGELLAFLVAEDTITVPGTDQNKSNECQIVGCHTKKQSNGSPWVDANATEVVRAVRLKDARLVVKVEVCVVLTAEASCALRQAARKVPNAKVSVLHMRVGSVVLTIAQETRVLKAFAAVI
ncbi:uncharacterized protein PHALS_09742 [Plasmopara halstedii]|uniref:Uncharacterized protein n=1 Tax=Plasmopara halstedii TaxID=4781 RepID=A0A0P1AEQ0_PLAHL|nr:uncharacterized protein PHALS_09742 [Plasmopara halstedii]CEG39498.1 hypothetical protein PHALS_09742 [Plasmopara halstedii]|eukprot:XP_024575867.1 hypothetical protein PHALS_09742 [Plasmopara halstedii]